MRPILVFSLALNLEMSFASSPAAAVVVVAANAAIVSAP